MEILQRRGEFIFCRSLEKDCARGGSSDSPPSLPPSVRPSVQSARHWLVDRPAADLEACCWLERWLHVEWTVRFSFSISICEDTNTQKGDYNTGKVEQLWICQLNLSSRFSRHHPCCEARCWRYPAVVGFRELEWQWSYMLGDDLSWAANAFDKVCSHSSMWIYESLMDLLTLAFLPFNSVRKSP